MTAWDGVTGVAHSSGKFQHSRWAGKAPFQGCLLGSPSSFIRKRFPNRSTRRTNFPSPLLHCAVLNPFQTFSNLFEVSLALPEMSALRALHGSLPAGSQHLSDIGREREQRLRADCSRCSTTAPKQSFEMFSSHER